MVLFPLIAGEEITYNLIPDIATAERQAQSKAHLEAQMAAPAAMQENVAIL
jgi:hypothetical protein